MSGAVLSTIDCSRLADLEAVIQRGMETFLEVGAALSEIRESQLYRKSYPTFEAYVSQRWGFSARRARQLMQASDIAVQLAASGTTVPLSSERVARELAPVIALHGPEAAAVIWERLNAGAPPKPTADDVKAAVAERLAPRSKPEPEPEHIGGRTVLPGRTPLALWRPDPLLNGPAAIDWHAAKLLARGDTEPATDTDGLWKEEETEESDAAMAPALARIEAFSQALMHDLFAVPLEHDHVAIRHARRALAHLGYRLACRQWAIGDEGQKQPGVRL